MKAARLAMVMLAAAAAVIEVTLGADKVKVTMLSESLCPDC